MPKIEKVIINNYKIFGGENIITFAVDDNKPFTAIVGANASGKSSVGEAIKWALGCEPYTHIESVLNFESASSLIDSNTDKISVELICETFYGKECFKRETIVGKKQDSLINIEDVYYINGEKLSYDQYLTITEKRFPLIIFDLFVWDEWMQLNRSIVDVEHKLSRKFYDEVERIKVMNLIARDATEIFQNLYSRTSLYEIKWNNKFCLYHFSGVLELCEDISYDMTLMVNVCILIATVKFLESCCACSNEFPIIIDNIVNSTDPRVLSLNKLCEILYPRQVLFLVKNRIFDDLDDTNHFKFEKKYVLQNNVDYTNANIIDL